MRWSLAVLLAALLVLPPAMAEAPEDAARIWTEQYGGDLVRSVTYSPIVIHEGEFPTVTLRLAAQNNVTDVSGQYCRVSGPTGGATCFRAGLESVSTESGTVWTIDIGAQGDEPFPIPEPVAGEHLGTQFFLTFDNGTQVNFPRGLPIDHPWFVSGTNEEYEMWDETQYFTFDVVADEAEPVPLGWLPWVVAGLVAAVASAFFFVRRHRTQAMALLVIALLLPLGYAVWALATTSAQGPDFTLTDTGYEDGEFRGAETFSLSDLEGQTVVLDFMAYNCAACRIVTPNVMEPLWEEYGHRDDFTILTIDVGNFANFPGSNTENLIKWQTEEFDGAWRHSLDTEGVFLDYVEVGAFGLPSVFILDGDRNIIYQNNGVPDRADMEEVIEASFEGQVMQADVLRVGVLGLALVAGVASFFAPCSVGLIPAYMGFLIQRRHKHGAGTIAPGLATAAGIVSLYGVLAIVLWLVQDALGSVIRYLGPIVGGLLVVLGILMFIGFDWERVAKLFGMGRVDGRRGFFAFGVGYGLAAFGCTGPIFLPILIAGFAQGTIMGFLAFGIYSLAVSSLVVFAAYLVGTGHQTRLRHILSKTKLITRISAGLLIAAGAYLIWYDVTAFSTA